MDRMTTLINKDGDAPVLRFYFTYLRVSLD